MTTTQTENIDGIILLHGAGMPDDKSRKRGDTISTITNGFSDFMQMDRDLSALYELVSTATLAESGGEKYVDELDIAIYQKAPGGRGPLKHRLRVREALWKPLTPELGLLDYLPMLATWALAFNSHVWRMIQPEVLDAHRLPDWDAKGIAKELGDEDAAPTGDIVPHDPTWREYKDAWVMVVLTLWRQLTLGLINWPHKRQDETHTQEKRRRWVDFRGMVLLAVLGATSTAFWLLAAGWLLRASGVLNAGKPEWLPDLIWLLRPYVRLIGTSIEVLSIIAAIILVVMALTLWVDKELHVPHSLLRLNLTLLATTWLAVFLTPAALLLYSFDRLARLAQLAFGGAAVVTLALNIANWVLNRNLLYVDWLLALTAACVVSIAAELIWRFVGEVRDNFQLKNVAVEWLNAMIVMAGAPVIAVAVYALEGLTPLPVIGKTFGWIRDRIPQVFWDLLKDIQIYLCDSSHAAQVRAVIEEQIATLARDSQVTSIHILGHSLGTIVGYDELAQLGRASHSVASMLPERVRSLIAPQADGQAQAANVQSPEQKIKTLVTYGGPLNKMRLLAERTARNPQVMAGFDYARFLPSVRLDYESSVFCWLNFYSPNDAVSDVASTYSHCEDVIKPRDYSTASATDFFQAHGSYWTDAGFWHTTLQAMGIIYPDLRSQQGDLYLRPELQRVEKLTLPLMCQLGAPAETEPQKLATRIKTQFVRHLVTEQLQGMRALGITTLGQIPARAAFHAKQELPAPDCIVTSLPADTYGHYMERIRLPQILNLLKELQTTPRFGFFRRLDNARLAIVLFILTLLGFAYFANLLPGIAIVQLEVAFTLKNFQFLVDQWKTNGTLDLQVRGLWLDLLSPFVYAPFLASALATLMAALNATAFALLKNNVNDASLNQIRERRDRAARANSRLWLPFMAGMLDWVENALLLYLLNNGATSEMVLLASVVATLKWALIIVSLFYVVVYLLQWLVLNIYRISATRRGRLGASQPSITT